jgi:hypothetical protein
VFDRLRSVSEMQTNKQTKNKNCLGNGCVLTHELHLGRSCVVVNTKANENNACNHGGAVAGDHTRNTARVALIDSVWYVFAHCREESGCSSECTTVTTLSTIKW